MTKDKILEILKERSGQVVSGMEMSKQLQVSRNAIWKAVHSLKKEGYAIESIQNGGYVFTATDDVLTGSEIKCLLETEVIGQAIEVFDEIDSTNTYAKKIGNDGAIDGTVIVAQAQTGGKGRIGRSFWSPPGASVYNSVLLRPQIPVAEINFITLMTAVVVVNTVEKLTGIAPQIKWTNDIFMGGKKLCGILTECSIVGETAEVEYVVVGMGINLNQKQEDFEESIVTIATSVFAQCGIFIRRATFIATFWNEFEKIYDKGRFIQRKKEILEEYRKHLFIIGRTVTVISPMASYQAVCIDIDEKGGLIVKDEDGRLQTLTSGEVSLKI